MVVDPTELTEPPTNRRKPTKWERIKRELLFWTTLTANLITIFYFLIKLWKR